jgi:hypothetical protein
MDEQNKRVEDAWPVGWASHEQAQLRRMAKQPLWKKLLWLQEVNRIARRMRRRQDHPRPAGENP